MDVSHGGGDPGMPEGGLDRDQVHATQVTRRRRSAAERGGVTTSGQSGSCVSAALVSAERSVSSPARAALPSAFLRSEGSSGTPGRVVIAELAAHILHEPAQIG